MPDSPAIQLLQLLWDNRQKETGHSWLKLNHAMENGLRLAIRMGMTFNEGDISVCFNRFRAGYWFGADSEWIYREAVLYRNASAWKCYEAWTKRKPFIVKGASIYVNTGDGPAGKGLARLIVGAEFVWNGERVRVGSFNDVKECLSANSITSDQAEERCVTCGSITKWPKDKILHRYTITHEMLAEERKRLRNA